MPHSNTSSLLLAITVLLAAFGCSESEPKPKDTSRQTTNLNEASWRFIRQDFEGETPTDPGFDDSSWLGVTLPHDWNGGVDGVHNDVFAGPEMYLGPAWYRATLPLDPSQRGQRLDLRFEAVAHRAAVWLNGTYLGEHLGGYTAFEYDVTQLVNWEGPNTLTVRASNANDPEIAPWMAEPFGRFPRASDYAPYGGIYRDVWLVARNPISVDAHFHETPSVSADSGTLTFRTTVSNSSSDPANITLVTDIVDAEGTVVQSVSSPGQVPASSRWVAEGTTVVDSPKLWSPQSPNLYRVRSRVMLDRAVVDEFDSPLGFRWYTLQNETGFVLNGEDSFLAGVNRHQDMQGLGYALPNEQHVKDVELMKGLGFNFIRHAHYPADEAFVRACDEQGVMLWLEVPVSTTVSDNPVFLESSLSQLQEMIEQSYNNPSVILWGLGNESDRIGAANLEAPRAYTTDFLRQLNARAKQLDSTRPTTGCNFVDAENQEIVDVYSPQEWSGWYSGDYESYNPTALIGEYGASIHLDDHDADHVSSGSVYPWPQEYPTEYHEFKASKGRSLRDQFPGHLVWVAFDFASPRADRSVNPIPFMNQKGLFLHDHETKKDVAYFYESFNTTGADNPMVYIVSETWTDRVTSPGPVTLWAYSNADTVELFNGTAENPKQVSLGTTTRTAGPRNDTRFQWDSANVVAPVLTAEASIGGQVVATHSITFEGSW